LQVGFAVLEELDTDVETNSAWETGREIIEISAKQNIGYYELKMLGFDEGCSKLFDQRKLAKIQWLQDSSEIIWDNVNNVECQASRHFRNKVMEYLKMGARDSIVVKALCYKPKGRDFETR
jgi:hypothetical protein